MMPTDVILFLLETRYRGAQADIYGRIKKFQ